MKKCFMLVVVLTTLLALVAQAQDLRVASGGTARNISLGGGPINPYLEDVMRVHTNPALLSKYANFVWGDIGYARTDASGDGPTNFGGGQYQYLGASFSLCDQWVLGVIVNKREGPMFNTSYDYAVDPVDALSDNWYPGFPVDLSHPMTPIEVAASYEASSVFNIGLSVAIAGWSDHTEIGTGQEESAGVVDVSSRMTGFKLGGSYDMGSGCSIDGAVLLRLNSANYTNSRTGVNPTQVTMSGGTEFGVDVRYIHKVNEKWNLVPIGRFSTFSWGPQVTPAPAAPSANPPYNMTHTEYEIGVGTQYHTDKVLVAGGISLQSITSTYEDKTRAVEQKETDSQLDMPKINLGVEFSVTDWLVARAGFFKRLSSSETKYEDSTLVADYKTSEELPYANDPNELNEGQQAFTLGVGFHFSGFSIDGTVGEGYLINGPWLLSGIEQNVFGMVSMHYLW